jgi:adenylate cyclase
MAMGVLTWLYRKLRAYYPFAFIVVEVQAAFPIAAGSVVLFSFYYQAATVDYLIVGGIVMALTAVGVTTTLVKVRPRAHPIERWIRGARGDEETRAAWQAAIELPLTTVRQDLVPVVLGLIPVVIASVIVLGAPWAMAFPVLVAALVTLGYSAILHYLVLEAGLRPVLVDISERLPPGHRGGHTGLSLRVRLFAAMPMIILIAGFVVAALTSDREGSTAISADVLIAVAVATAISLELTILLTKSILRPVADLHQATHAVAEGRWEEVRVPVTTGDELGELAASFNEMVDGLRERERIREAFGTYLDRDVAEYILSEGFSEDGVDVDVSVLFCDVRDFTSFASEATPQEVVAALNRLFEAIVPVIRRHGGHVDKFEGDGLLAVFGAPQPYDDHAERAVSAACEIARRVNSDGEAGELRVGVGVNSGHVIAGSIGGAGRLDFSVIGNPVNIAARVEEATKQLDDSVLITAATRDRLDEGFDAESRGEIELRGFDEPVPLYAPSIAGAERERAPGGEREPAGTPGGDDDGRPRLPRLLDRLRP